MSTLDDYLKGAVKHIGAAQELFNKGDWLQGTFELGCATARIFQAVEWLNEHVGNKPTSYRT